MTVDIFCNKEFVSNIRPAPEPLILKSNGGELIAHPIANVADYDEPVWFSKKAITNIFMLKNMKKQYRVTYDSLEQTFQVHREATGLPNLLFKEHGNGLNFFDPRQADFAFVKMVESNMRLYSKRHVVHADKANSLYASLGFPSQKDFMWILRSNQIKDFPVTVEDAMVAYKIWGPSVAALKGKAVRKMPQPIKTDIVSIPREICELHKEVTLTINIFFVNKIPFFLTLSRVPTPQEFGSNFQSSKGYILLLPAARLPRDLHHRRWRIRLSRTVHKSVDGSALAELDKHKQIRAFH